MAIEIILNGTTRTVTREELFDLAATGTIKPETPINVNGKLTTAGKIKGITFGQQHDIVKAIPSIFSAEFQPLNTPVDDIEDVALQTLQDEKIPPAQQFNQQHQTGETIRRPIPPPLPTTPKDQCPRCYGYAWNGHSCKQCGYEIAKPDLSSKAIEILIDGQVVNTVTVDELYTLAAEGTIDSQTIVRIKGKLIEAGRLNGIVFERQLREKKQREAERQERLRLQSERHEYENAQLLAQSKNAQQDKPKSNADSDVTLAGCLAMIGAAIIFGSAIIVAGIYNNYNEQAPQESVRASQAPSVPSNAPKQSVSVNQESAAREERNRQEEAIARKTETRVEIEREVLARMEEERRRREVVEAEERKRQEDEKRIKAEKHKQEWAEYNAKKKVAEEQAIRSLQNLFDSISIGYDTRKNFLRLKDKHDAANPGFQIEEREDVKNLPTGLMHEYRYHAFAGGRVFFFIFDTDGFLRSKTSY